MELRKLLEALNAWRVVQIEGKCVQDADGLDVIGAIGIAKVI